jgi:tetratricopeptide (TPR) repeat protein
MTSRAEEPRQEGGQPRPEEHARDHDPGSWARMAADEIESMMSRGEATAALRRCEECLRRPTLNARARSMLLQRRADIRFRVGDHHAAAADVAVVRADGGPLAADEDGRLHRIEAYAAATAGEWDQARHHLNRAEGLFHQTGHTEALALLHDDRILLGVHHDDSIAIELVLQAPPSGSVSEVVLRAEALRRMSRFEQALTLLLNLNLATLDPIYRFRVLHLRTALHLRLRQTEQAQSLRPTLAALARIMPDPDAAADAAVRVFNAGVVDGTTPPFVVGQVGHARRLVVGGRLEEAAGLLDGLVDRARSPRELALLHLARGELALRRAASGDDAALGVAVGMLIAAQGHADGETLVTIRTDALRLLGEAYRRLGHDDLAARCLAVAHELEERVARRQGSDEVIYQLLEAVPNEHDLRVLAAAVRLDPARPETVAPVVVAMEAARGAAILAQVLPDHQDGLRELPGPHDPPAASRWLVRWADRLPDDQAAWIMHATPDQLHHAVLGRGLLRHVSFPVNRVALTARVDALMVCWRGPAYLEGSVRDGFTSSLRAVSDLLRVDEVLTGLPDRIRRLVVVAGGALSDVPWAAVATSGHVLPLGLRFALSDLPCLSALLPLRHRAQRRRGDDQLVVAPPDGGLTVPAGVRVRTVLGEGCGSPATRSQLRAHLAGHHYVRVNCHGRHDPNRPDQSWLELTPDGAGDDGKVTAADLRELNLAGCTTLVLGACESGMAQRTGRDERVGFVRAGFNAGAAAVLAARWAAVDTVAAAVLSRFEEYVRYLPRDVALQRALRAAYDGSDRLTSPPAARHAARWACWTLYGDSGHQTAAGPLTRTIRRLRHQWRNDMASADAVAPRVFISFAGPDRDSALLLGGELAKRGLNCFVDSDRIALGENLVEAISRALDQTHFFVLLWSKDADRPWVTAEWTAALARALDQPAHRRSFLVVVRLDLIKELPALLAPRMCLDWFTDEPDPHIRLARAKEVVDDLVEAWRRDMDLGMPVFAGPRRVGEPTEDDMILHVYVRNWSLSVAHVLPVSIAWTGPRVEGAVRDALGLPADATALGGAVGVRFHYRFRHRGRSLPAAPVASIGMGKNACIIDLEVEVEQFGPDGSRPAVVYRTGEPPKDQAPESLPPAMLADLVQEAFGHLLP